MTALPPSQWYLGYRPTPEDFQHISDEAVSRVQGQLSSYVANPLTGDLDAAGHKILNPGNLLQNPATGIQDMNGKAIINAPNLALLTGVEQVIARVTVPTTVGAVAIPIPAGFVRLNIGWNVACPATAGILALRFSLNGSTFDTSTSYYYATQEVRSTTTNAVYTGNPATNLFQLNGSSSANQIQNGTFSCGPSGYGFLENSIIDAAGTYFNYGSMVYGAGTAVAAVLLTHTSGANFKGGEFWVTGITA